MVIVSYPCFNCGKAIPKSSNTCYSCGAFQPAATKAISRQDAVRDNWFAAWIVASYFIAAMAYLVHGTTMDHYVFWLALVSLGWIGPAVLRKWRSVRLRARNQGGERGGSHYTTNANRLAACLLVALVLLWLWRYFMIPS